MSKKKGASSSAAGAGTLVEQVRQAAETVMRDLQRRLPKDLGEQVEKSVTVGQKAVQASIERLQSRLNRTASQSDLDKLSRRIDSLAKQVQQLEKLLGASGARTQARGASVPRRRSKPAREAEAEGEQPPSGES